jgi:hypothetical protein
VESLLNKYRYKDPVPQFKLTFALVDPGPSIEEDVGSIVVWPPENKWNDFGYSYRAEAR